MPRLRESLKWMLTKTAFFCEFSMLTRSFSGMNTSDDRVMTVFSCDSRSLRSRRWATSSATIFSGGPDRRYVPLSLPPWPASTTTVVKVLLVFLTLPVCVAHAPSEASKTMARAQLIGRDILINSRQIRFPPKVFRWLCALDWGAHPPSGAGDRALAITNFSPRQVAAKAPQSAREGACAPQNCPGDCGQSPLPL